MFNTTQEIVESIKHPYSATTYAFTYVPEGKLEVFIVQNRECYYIWNKHPLRKGWQMVYTLEKCYTVKQAQESLASLKRLFE